MTFKRFFFQCLRPYRRYCLMLACIGIIWGLFTSATPYVVKLMIDALVSQHSMHAVILLGGVYVMLNVLMAGSFRWLDWVYYRMRPILKADVAMRVFNHIKRHSKRYYQNHFVGDISNKVNDLISNIDSLVSQADNWFASLVAFFIGAITMYLVNPLFSLVLLLWCVIFTFFSYRLSQKVMDLSKLTSSAYSAYAGTLVDILGNICSVRLFAHYRHESQHLQQAVDKLVGHDRRQQMYVLKMRMVQDASLIVLLSCMMALLVVLYQQKQVTVGDFALIMTLTMSMFHGLWYVASQLSDLYKQLGKCAQAMSLLSTPNEIVNADDAVPLQCERGNIDFADVTFAYESGGNVYHKLCLQIPAGQKVGLVGFSGCGKSTLINLLTRQFDLLSGKISIDAQDISKVTLDSLREHISLIPQDPALFHRSLRDNISYGNLEATEEMVMHAAKQAHCHEFIAALSDGYDTLVGERGVKLSGGQRQRIAIARALLDSAPILVLDEATSSLDSVTEKIIQESLQCAFKDRTTIVVAHRLSTLLQMDRIIVIDNGQIIEDGSHADLLSVNGHFARMWTLQKDGFLPDKA